MRQLFFPTLAALALMALATQAQAHAQLEAAVPRAGSTVTTSPGEIRLTFSEGVVPRLSGIVLSDAAGRKLATGEATQDGKDKAVLVVPITGPLPPGVCTVAWHAVAEDSHKTQGSFTFTLKP